MKAVIYERFSERPHIATVPDPTPQRHGVVIQVEATGVCRSDWHGWMGHDSDIALPHVPGHEFAGVVVAAGKDANKHDVGKRVTVPFVSGCGACPYCHAGQQQVCDNQFQPGFTHWGSFAELVAVDYADINLVELPDSIDFVTAASLGCRFGTAYRGVVDQGRTLAGQWVAVHGCGGVGLSAVMIGNALGANVIAINISDEQLELAQQLGAVKTINATNCDNVADAVIDYTGGGAHVSLDALGHPSTCFQSISSLRKRGRHIQIGLMLADHSQPAIPMDKVVANELEILGSHGIQAHRYTDMLAMIVSGKLQPERLIGDKIFLEQSIDTLINMDKFEGIGMTVVDQF